MVLLQHKLSVKLSQRQILTPGLVQMVSVLALNKLELKDMINAEMVENPVLEELEDAVPLIDDVGRKEEERDRVAAAATEENPVTTPETKDPFEEIDFGSFFQEYLDPGYRSQGEMEEIERPSFENFLSKPGNLTDHLIWQLGALGVRSEVREAAELVIGNLSEDGYLIASDEELIGTAAPASPEADAVTQQNLVKEAAALGLSATETEAETDADIPGVASELEEQGTDRSPAEDGARALGVPQIEHRGLRVDVGRAEARRMIRVALDLRRPPHVAGGEHAERVAGADGRRGGEGERHAGDDLLRLLDVGDDGLERLLGAGGGAAERQRGSHQLHEAAAVDAEAEWHRLARELVLHRLLEGGAALQLVEGAPERRCGALARAAARAGALGAAGGE